MDYTFEELKKKTVAELREIAEKHEHESLHGYKTMHKEDLLQVLCQVLGVDTHVHHEIVGIDKSEIKARIRALKAERDAALEAHDYRRLKTIRRKIHRLKRVIRKATV
ncbi:MAG: hypothetical protein ACE5OP_07355 [Candidatus Glassbacteria bacterium]